MTAKTTNTVTADRPANIGDLVAAAHRADTAAREAWAAVREAERANAALQAERVRDAWQAWADGYDPAALRAAVVDAHTARDVATLATAVLREQQAHRLAVEAQAAGATLPAAVPAGEAGDHLRDHTGAILRGSPHAEHPPLPAWLGTDAMTAAAIADAERTIAGEAAAVRATVEAARQSVERPEPTGYAVTVTGPRAGDTFDHHGVRFAAGTATVPADHPQLAHYRRHPERYRIEPLFAGAAPATVGAAA